MWRMHRPQHNRPFAEKFETSCITAFAGPVKKRQFQTLRHNAIETVANALQLLHLPPLSGDVVALDSTKPDALPIRLKAASRAARRSTERSCPAKGLSLPICEKIQTPPPVQDVPVKASARREAAGCSRSCIRIRMADWGMINSPSNTKRSTDRSR